MKYIVLMILAMGVTLTFGQVIFEEDFNVTTTPAGWLTGGSFGSSHTDVGTAKTDSDLFQNDGGPNYLRLSNNTAWNRGWAYYADQKFPILGHWKMEMDIRIGRLHDGNQTASSADGLAFVFLDANTVETAGVLDPNKVIGGYGQYMGAPRGGLPNTPVNGALGYTPGLLGYSFEFDHYSNSSEPSTEYIHWVSLENWAHSGLGIDLAPDTDFYFNNGWQRVELEGNNGILTVRYKWNGSSYTATHTMDTLNPSNPSCDPLHDYMAYFGIGAATGQRFSAHEVRYVKLEMIEDETLPVALSTFTAVQTTVNNVRLNWTTQSETAVGGFYIYRNQEQVLETARVVSPLLSATNTATARSYQFLDSEITESGVYYYWLGVSNLDGSDEYYGPVQIAYNMMSNPGSPSIPLSTVISNVYPNPFNPSTTISYSLKSAAEVHFELYNAKGQKVFEQFPGFKDAGNHKLVFEGKANDGRSLASGIYYLVLRAGSERSSKKLVLTK
jgi:hypothetical protein